MAGEIMTGYTIYSAKLGSTVIGVTDQSISPGLIEAIHRGAGATYPSFAGVMGANPQISISVVDVATAMGSFAGLSGGQINSGTTSALTMGMQSIPDGETRGSGSTHVLMTVNLGLIVPRSLSAQTGSTATLSYDITPVSDGDTAPISIVSNSALSHGNPTPALYRLGPVYFGNTLVSGVQRSEVNFGISLATHSDSGAPFLKWTGINTADPGVTLSSMDAALFDASNLGLIGKTLSTGATMFLRQMQFGNTPWPDSSQKHIKLTIPKCRVSITQIGGSHGQVVMPALKLTLTEGSSAILIPAFNQAIAAPLS